MDNDPDDEIVGTTSFCVLFNGIKALAGTTHSSHNDHEEANFPATITDAGAVKIKCPTLAGTCNGKFDNCFFRIPEYVDGSNNNNNNGSGSDVVVARSSAPVPIDSLLLQRLNLCNHSCLNVKQVKWYILVSYLKKIFVH
jgi:hypothetical protein